MARIAVPDARDEAAYRVTVLEVADRANRVRASLDGYGISVRRAR